MLFADPPAALTPVPPSPSSIPEVNPLVTLWAHVVDNLRSCITPDAYDRWFSSLCLSEANDERVSIVVPDSIHQLWIEMNYLNPLKDSFHSITGIMPTLRFTASDAAHPVFAPVATRSKKATAPAEHPAKPNLFSETLPNHHPVGHVPPQAAAHEGHGVSQESVRKDEGEQSADLPTSERGDVPEEGEQVSPRHTFGTFVVGANNQFAHAAATAVAQRPARAYNPLFFYGTTGLGKTHLMHAIGQHIREARPKARVLYITSEEFTNQFIAALQDNSLPRFRKRFRQADVLLIDDVQFLAGKERSQEEFFHTFNALFDGNKQVVLSSDRPPSEMQKLESRLASRFEWGMMAEITPPDEETRVAILRNRAVTLRVEVPPNVIDYLASRIRSNVRRLHGALFRVASWISLHGPISMPQTEDLLRDILQEESRQTITIDKIQKTIAESYDIRLADMTSRKRPANIAFARQVAMYLARDLTGSSYQEIGDAFGGRDHGTIMHACRSIDAKIKAEESVRLKIEGLASVMRRGM